MFILLFSRHCVAPILDYGDLLVSDHHDVALLLLWWIVSAGSSYLPKMK